jgi:transcription antitermination protein NusB
MSKQEMSKQAPSKQANKRGTARLHAVQALYQMDVASTPIHEVLATFNSFYMGQEIENMEFLPADSLFFRHIVEGVLASQTRLDPAIDEILEKTWPLKRIDSVMRATLRAGAFELFGKADIPAKVIIAEYVDVADAFFDADERGMINAVLDGLAKKVRGEEMT